MSGNIAFRVLIENLHLGKLQVHRKYHPPCPSPPHEDIFCRLFIVSLPNVTTNITAAFNAVPHQLQCLNTKSESKNKKQQKPCLFAICNYSKISWLSSTKVLTEIEIIFPGQQKFYKLAPSCRFRFCKDL